METDCIKSALFELSAAIKQFKAQKTFTAEEATFMVAANQIEKLAPHWVDLLAKAAPPPPPPAEPEPDPVVEEAIAETQSAESEET